jgi:trigger factor
MYTHKVEDVNSTRKKFEISAEKTQVAEAFSKALVQVQSAAELRGFRKGKAPHALVKKFYGEEVAKRAYSDLVEASYQDAVKGVDFQIVSYPNIEPVGQFAENESFTFHATVDINPKVEIQGYKELTLKQKGADPVVEDQIQKTILQIQRERGKIEVETSRASVAGDIVTIDYSLEKDGKALEEKQAKGVRISLDGSNFADLEAGLVGLKAGTPKSFFVTLPADYMDTALQGQKVQFTVTLKTLESVTPAVLDDAFAKTLGAESVDALKQNIKNSLQNMNDKAKIAKLKDQIIEQVLAKNSFEVPESLIEGTIDRSISENNSQRAKENQMDGSKEEVRAQFRDWAVKEVKGVLALGHIARAEALTVEDKEVSSEMASFAVQNGTHPQQLIKQYGSAIVEEFRGKVLIDKVMKHLVGLNKIEIEA